MGTVSQVRLMQLCSSTLPVGGFTYSQGVERAVECQWVTTEDDLRNWLIDLMKTNLQQLEIPVFLRMAEAYKQGDHLALQRWSDTLLAYRETSELRQEESNRGRAMLRLIVDLAIPVDDELRPIIAKTQTAGFALAAQEWTISIPEAAQGFAWTWLENLVIAGVKLVPLGQVSGQRILMDLAESLADCVEKGLAVTDDELGSSSPALAYASSKHETQYTRLFRS